MAKKGVAQKADPELWEACKEKAIQKMGGKFSARAMQYAVKIYKENGGEYVGPKSGENSLSKWTKEDWDYVGKEGNSRYLPKKARQRLTPAEKAVTSRAKNKGTKAGKQWVKQPEKIAKKTAKYRNKK